MSIALSLPPLCDDITLYSIVGLTARLNGHENSRAISQLLFGSPVAGLRHDFPSDLAHFCEMTGGQYGDTTAIVNGLTTIPYFLRFRKSPSSTEVVQQMCESNVERLKFALGLPASPIGALLALRHCPECAEHDLNEQGFAYWHREHQLPSSLVCPKHEKPLLQARIRTDGTGWSFLHLPLDPRDYGEPPAPLIDRPSPLLLQLAKLGSMALGGNDSSNEPDALQYAYLHGLKQNGLLTRTGQVRATEFIDRIEKTYRPIANLPPFDRIINHRVVDGLLKLVRKPRSPANPVSHLLLINFLFGNWELFTSVLSWEEHIDRPLLSSDAGSSPLAPPDLTPPPHLAGRLSTISQRLTSGNISLTKACKEEGVDIGTAMRWLGKLGYLRVSKRPKKLNEKLLAEAKELLGKGLPLVQIGKQLGLSKASIDRICTDSPEQFNQWKIANLEWKRMKYRQAFLNAILANPELSRKELRKLNGAGFSWLYRHDQDWLTERLPTTKTISRPKKQFIRRARVDWNTRDQECCRALEQIGHDIQLESWERIKPQAILRRLPKLSFTPRLNRLPRSGIAITAILNRVQRNHYRDDAKEVQ